MYKNIKLIRRINATLLGGSIVCSIVGVLYKIMHWPYASVFIVVGLSVFVFSVIVGFIVNPKKGVYEWSKLFAFILYPIRAMFVLFHWPYKEIVTIAFVISLFVFAIAWLNRKEDDEENAPIFSITYILNNIISVIAVLLIAFGTLFTIMHWPGGEMMLIFGMAAGLAWAIKDLFLKK